MGPPQKKLYLPRWMQQGSDAASVHLSLGAFTLSTKRSNTGDCSVPPPALSAALSCSGAGSGWRKLADQEKVRICMHSSSGILNLQREGQHNSLATSI